MIFVVVTPEASLIDRLILQLNLFHQETPYQPKKHALSLKQQLGKDCLLKCKTKAYLDSFYHSYPYKSSRQTQLYNDSQYRKSSAFVTNQHKLELILHKTLSYFKKTIKVYYFTTNSNRYPAYP